MRGTAGMAKTAVDFHSAIAEEFAGKYLVSLGFRERFEVWTGLFGRYIKPGSRVVDLGCGSGVLSAYLGERGCTVTGIDGSARMIALCEKNRRSANERYVLERLPLANPTLYATADVVIASSLLEYLDDLPGALAQIQSMLPPGGLFLASMPNRFCLWRRIERRAYALTGKPTYFGHIRNRSDVATFNEQLHQLGFDALEIRFFSSFDPVSRFLKYVLAEPLVNNLFVGVYRKH